MIFNDKKMFSCYILTKYFFFLPQYFFIATRIFFLPQGKKWAKNKGSCGKKKKYFVYISREHFLGIRKHFCECINL